MNRALKIAACLLAATAFLPANAEAKRRFFSSGSGHNVPSTTTSRTAIIPAVGASRARASDAGAPQRAPFPPASAMSQPDSAPPLLRLSAGDDKNVWCRSEVVIGGFCMVN